MTELQQAQVEYPKASATEKKLLEKIFGKEPFTPKTNRPVSFEAALETFKKMKFKDAYYLKLQKLKSADFNAIDKLVVIARIIQGAWQANWRDGNEKKWWAYFLWNYSSSGFGFSRTYYDYEHTYTHCGSRLCFPNSEDAEYFGKQFIDIHNEFLTIK